MERKDLPSESDDSDADFVPDGVNEDLSEEESGNESNRSNTDDEADKGSVNKKHRKSSLKKKPKGRGEEKNEDQVEETSEIKETTLDINKVWAEFKEDVGKQTTVKHSTENLPAASGVGVSTKDSIAEKEEPSSKKPRLGVASRGRGRGGLNSILGQLGQKNKLSMLEKSKQDWNSFKQKEGIEEDLKTFNRGKDGYLEKQDFLERSDHRQFEIEKQLRATKRSNR